MNYASEIGGNLENIQGFLDDGQCHKIIVRCLLRRRANIFFFKLFFSSANFEQNLQELDTRRDYTKCNHGEEKNPDE